MVGDARSSMFSATSKISGIIESERGKDAFSLPSPIFSASMCRGDLVWKVSESCSGFSVSLTTSIGVSWQIATGGLCFFLVSNTCTWASLWTYSSRSWNRFQDRRRVTWLNAGK